MWPATTAKEWHIENETLGYGYDRVAQGDPEALMVLQDLAVERGFQTSEELRVAAGEAWSGVFFGFPRGSRPVKGAFEAMAGETIRSIAAVPNRLKIQTNVGNYLWEPEGDCCAEAYLAEIPSSDEFQAVVGKEIVKWDIGEATTTGDKDGYDVLDTQFYTLHAGREMLQLTLRTEHNGYYSGWLELWAAPEVHWRKK